MSATLVFRNQLVEPVWLLLENADEFDHSVITQMDGLANGARKFRYFKKIEAGNQFELKYVSASNGEPGQTGTTGTAGSIAYFARRCKPDDCQYGKPRWNGDVDACTDAFGCEHGGLPGIGNAMFEFDVDTKGQLWGDLSAIDGIQDKEIHVDYGECGNLGEAHCSMPPTINDLYQFETFTGDIKFASSYQFSCYREQLKKISSPDEFENFEEIVKKLASTFPNQRLFGDAKDYDFSGDTKSSCESTCILGDLELTTSAFQMSTSCGCTGCGITDKFDSESMKYCSGRESGDSTIDDLCRPPKGFKNSSDNNIVSTEYYKELDKRCKNTYLYPYDDKNATAQCAIANNPKITVTIGEPSNIEPPVPPENEKGNKKFQILWLLLFIPVVIFGLAMVYALLFLSDEQINNLVK